MPRFRIFTTVLSYLIGFLRPKRFRRVLTGALALALLNLVASPPTPTLAAVPSRSTISPADNATGISTSTSLTITFNIPVDRGTGNVEVKKVNNPVTVESLDVATSSAITGWGTTTITIAISPLRPNTDYYINYPATAFKDVGSSDYAAAITNNSTWNFRTTGVPWAFGDGTSGNPWQITTCEELFSIDAQSAYWDDSYELANDIDCTGKTVFPMIYGGGSTQFTGALNGKSKTISNLTITCSAQYGCGIFSKVTGGASFTNLNFSTVTINHSSATYYNTGVLFGAQSGSNTSAITVSNIAITGMQLSTTNSFIGGIAGNCATCLTSNVSTAGTITGKNQVGGVYGKLGDQSSSVSTAATLSNVASSATISATLGSTSSAQHVGGILGSYTVASSVTTANRTLSNVSFSGSVTADSNDVGGIAGNMGYGILIDVESTGSVTGFDDVGGLVGDFNYGTIETSSTSGTIHATRTDNCSGQVGGLVGTMMQTSISQSFSTATVKGYCRLGGLIGGATPLSSTTFLDNSYFVGALEQTAAGTYAGGSMGGLIGLTNATATIARSYAVITNATKVGTPNFQGLIGSKYSHTQSLTCTNVYWDNEISSITTDGVCGATPAKSTADMKTQATYTGFDFTSVWSISGATNSGYPVLRAFSSATAPSAPTITSITAGDTTLSVAFTAPSDGGSPITNYEYSIDGTTYTLLSPASTTSPIVLTGLTNGTAYPVTIKAVNTVGSSAASNSVSGTPTGSAPPTSTTSSTTTTVASPTTTTAPTSSTTVAPAPAPETTVATTTTTTTTIPSTTRTLSISGAASSYLVTQAGPGLTAAPSAGSGAISWASLTPGVCSIGSIAMMSILSKQSSVSVGRLNTVGTCTIRASIAATSTHDAASSTVSFAVTRVRPTLRMSVRELSPDDQFFLRITLPSAVSSNQTLLEQMYAAVQFESITPDSCEVDIITAYDESIARYGSSWAGVHVSVTRSGDDACGVRAELPLGVRWFRVTSDPATMSATSVTTTTSTTSTTTTTIVSSSSTLSPTTSVATSATTAPASATSVPFSGAGEPSLTSFAPTPSTVPVVDLDLAAQIIIEANVTAIVITGESIEASARELNVTTGFVRVRPNTGDWTRVSLPRPADVRLTLTARTSSLEFRFEPLDGEPILVSVPLAIVVNNSRTWLYAVVAFLAGSVATYFWFVAGRRRRRRAMPPPPVA